MPLIRAENLVKTYSLGDSLVKAVDHVSLEIEEGQMAAIMGPSGSGKSTLMNLLGCLDHPDSGDYFLADRNIAKLHKNQLAEIRNRSIGFVFQFFNLLPRISALENVELPLHYAKVRRPKKKAEEALASVGLSNRLRHKPTQLSGGQRQRVAIARALVMDPFIIFADEPTGNLDTKTGKEIMELFGVLNSDGRTIVIVTHDQEVTSHCGRVIQMRDGRIVEDN